MILIAASLLALVRGGALAQVARAQTVATIAAVAAVLAAADMLLHLVVAVEADRLAAGRSTPLTDVHVVAETLTVPAFGLSIAALALVGAWTRTVGNPVAAVLGVVGGLVCACRGDLPVHRRAQLPVSRLHRHRALGDRRGDRPAAALSSHGSAAGAAYDR